MVEWSDPDSRWPFFPTHGVAVVRRILKVIYAHVVRTFLARVRSDKSPFKKIRRAANRVQCQSKMSLSSFLIYDIIVARFTYTISIICFLIAKTDIYSVEQ